MRTIKRTIIILLFLLVPSIAFALTPIARTDVVPYQRIEYGTSFKFGVIAFSKAGIDRVDFAISGQGYSSGTKSSSTMALNTRVASGQGGNPGSEYTGVYEYFVEIPANEFSSNGIITVTPTVYGDDAGSRALSAVTMYVEGASDASPVEAWVATDGNDGTGTVGNDSLPYATFAGAMADIETANGGVLDYATLYLEEGSYDIDNYSGTTTNERFRVTRASGASIDNTILNEGGTAVEGILLKVEGVTMTSQGSVDYVLDDGSDGVWVDKCKMIGPGRTTSSSHPVSSPNVYMTDSYIYNVAFGIQSNPAIIMRGLDIQQIADDLITQDKYLLVNTWLTDQDPEGTGWHSDVRQTYFGTKPDNSIMYNVVAKELYYQGIFHRIQNAALVEGTAYVNIFIDLKLSKFPGCGGARFGGGWNHTIVWHNTIIGTEDPGFCAGDRYAIVYLTDEDGYNGSFDNTSWIGNVFQRFQIGGLEEGYDSEMLDSGNGFGNEATYNHYRYTNWSEPGENYTTGTGVLDFVTNYGYPIANSDIHDALPSNITGVPCDAYGNLRDSTPDVGALELSSEPDVTAPVPDPMTWASEPGENGTTQIDMTSTTGSDSTPPIEYYFNYDQANTQCGADGGTGGTDSGWQQTDTTYSDSGLEVNQCYGYTVQARDAIPNTGTASAVSADYTAANTPGAPILSNATLTTLDIQNDANGNPTANPGTTYAIQVVTTSPEDVTWLNKWIDASGDPQAAEVWLSDATWDAITLQGLTSATTYGAKSKARNGDNTATPLSAEGQYTTTSGFTPPMHGASGSGLNVAP